MIDQQQLEAALPHIAASGLPLLVHAELAGPIDRATATLQNADWRKLHHLSASRPDEAELEAIRLMIRLCRQYNFRLHIVHLSTALALDDLKAARAEGLPITVETCPHYLHFAAEDIPDGATLLKCAPPIRSRANQRSPLASPPRRRNRHDRHRPLPLPTRDEAHRHRPLRPGLGRHRQPLHRTPPHPHRMPRRGFTLDHIARWMSSAPASLAGIHHRAGSLEPNREANFIIFDTEAEFTVTPDKLHYRHPISAYMGENLRGTVKATYLRGKPIYQNGLITDTPHGRELTLS